MASNEQPEDPTWSLIYDHFDPATEGHREALCTLGNGHFCTRGAAEEAQADRTHYPGTYLAGGYNRLRSVVAGHTVENEDLVNFPNWLPLSFRPEGGLWLNLSAYQVVQFRQVLDLRSGLLRRDMTVRDHAERTTLISTERFVSMRSPHLALLQFRLTPMDWSGPIELRGLLDGAVVNDGVARYRELNSQHLKVLDKGRAGDDRVFLHSETSQSAIRMAQVARLRLTIDDQPADWSRDLYEDPLMVGETLHGEAHAGQQICVEKRVHLFSSRSTGLSECLEDALAASTHDGSYTTLRAQHQTIWTHLWERYDQSLEGAEPQLQLAMRLNAFHLLQTVSMHSVDLDAGVPARGWHGEAYRGHVFWDSLFILPFYDLRIPQISRSLIMYRYRRLQQARWNAAAIGCRGALFPWQSGSSGREETQSLHLNPRSGHWDPDHSRLQYHVNSALAFNVWRYFIASGDMDFMNVYGAPLMLEIARFWSSFARPEGNGRYGIHGVVGPDEYHEKYPGETAPGLRNNAYTNVLAAWVLERAKAVLEMRTPARQAELLQRLEIDTKEIEHWQELARCLHVPLIGDGVIEQFEGYGDLPELDWAAYRAKYGDIQRLDRILKAEGDSPDNYKVSKQADVMMLFHIFSPNELAAQLERMGVAFDADAMQRNLDFYRQRTSHGSTLSLVVHGSVLSRQRDPSAWDMFTQSMLADLNDVQGGTTAEGIHLGAMAGGVDIVLRHFAGVATCDAGLQVRPALPPQLHSLRLKFRFRGLLYALHIQPECFQISCDTLHAQTLLIDGQPRTLQPAQTLELETHRVVLIPAGEQNKLCRPLQ